MPTRTRSARVTVPGSHIQFANTVAELINLSPSGALIRMNFELRRGGEWPLVLELPASGPVWLHGRVVRCRRHDGAFILALSFVAPTAETQAVLSSLCSTPAPPLPQASPKDKRPRPLPWRLPRFSLQRLMRARWSGHRQCPECHSTDVTKERSHSYSCFQCGCRFFGFRIGKIRISL